MAITLNGTTGISSPGGDTSTSLATTNLSYTGTLTGGTGVIAIGTNQIYKNASGNVGLGVTPNTWYSGYTALEFKNYGAITSRAASNSMEILTNAYRNASANYVYKQTGAAQILEMANGAYNFYIASSGTAGATFTPTQAMTLDASGNLVIGNTSANRRLEVSSASADYQIRIGAGITNPGFTYDIGRSTVDGYLYFYGNQTGANGYVFSGVNGERARIDSSGNFLVGGTPASAKLTVRADLTSAVNSNRAALLAGTTGADSSYEALAIVKNANDTANANKFQAFYINAGNTSSGYITANGANAAGFSSSSDSRLKENITALPNQLANICALKPSEFDYKDGSGHQIGFIAQEMEEVYPDCVAEDGDGMLMISGWSKTEARLVKAIQELTTRLAKLEAQ